MKHKQTVWIGVDWGTSNVRAVAVDDQGKVIAVNQSNRGMSSLQTAEFEPALLELIAPWLRQDTPIPVFACGMVGARQGWQEAPYSAVPCLPVCNNALSVVPTIDKRIIVHILPGLSQEQPADVMRGEETQIAGLLQLRPSFQGCVCLPGTHSKWAVINDSRIASFKTHMTGELFSLLCNHSVLQHSVDTNEWDDSVFRAAALQASETPETTMADLFAIRASSLLHDTDSISSRCRLSGMLIGYELGVTKHVWQNNELVVIGAAVLAALYKGALRSLGAKVSVLDAGEATIAGLTTIANHFLKNNA